MNVRELLFSEINKDAHRRASIAMAEQAAEHFPTLDDFSTMAMSEFELKSARWIPQDLKLPPTLNLAELGSCADILSDPAHFLDYFATRERLQGATQIFGYEMDYLGLYLENRLDLPELSAGTHSGMIAGMSSAIDRYYLSRDTGNPVAKPGVLDTQY